MTRTSKELYGNVPKNIVRAKRRIAKEFIKLAKKRIDKLQEIRFEMRDESLINDCLKARDFWTARLKEK